MERFLSAHELSALMLIKRSPEPPLLSIEEIEKLLSHRYVEFDRTDHLTARLCVTTRGDATLTAIEGVVHKWSILGNSFFGPSSSLNGPSAVLEQAVVWEKVLPDVKPRQCSCPRRGQDA